MDEKSTSTGAGLNGLAKHLESGLPVPTSTKPGLGTPTSKSSVQLDTSETVDEPIGDEPEDDGRKIVKRLSPAERAVIGDRTNQVISKAQPGSKEYADACAERAENGLSVPVPRKTAVDMLAVQQFQAVGEPVVVSKPRYGVWLVVALGVLAAGMIAFAVIPEGKRDGGGAATNAATTKVERAAAKPTPGVVVTAVASEAVKTASPETSSEPAPSATEAVTSSVGTSTGKVGPIKPTATATAAAPPKASVNPWAPVWKK